ncbi:O-acetylhomoserine aminocarboxypropyltransferase/cysteine synthase family protein [Prevotella histicola]|jgi:O-acetylhomoserine aminocarboxypropyltransferase/cysteine synthase|uniref:O-acetylhomoserine aminocarboxypropyltransferase/cysteine synthase family protein n=1 Tax=Prevotella histicola TaxID=470565 RepID=UPI001C5F2798|nr:O-acetylhomoserine aminocarboxypropyltransferase/cysteine synthase family protein [Prevotella histicola]MBF1398651.1 O-acetylhomoserine aminocarboxypropyltransferase/cysteine synthase [Prevotella histicola]MBF1400719.1 O-acetylhomoserine aminocarboxypropyltransferase/cysteine synthase [Prevotella histicola]MBF1401970.1 O-acetylhomoserine aminocarboxypropyltransferase/cysteine synthase [Prevotella histicola]MBF1408244.1 O-acetylhomoserine aminocarboxypropyltransferase/cysteine synthase [Prevo
MAKQKYHFETLQLHVGQEQADPATDARAVPIYQTTSYVFHDCQHAADRFALKDAGNVYGRLTNSTQAVLEERVAALEGGVAGLAVASGAAAVTYAITNIANAGDHVVASKTIYGGTYNLLAHTLSKFGITTTFVDPDDYEALEAAIKDNTKLVYIETLGNPNSNISDIERSADIAHRHGLPLLIDNTFGTPYLIRPIEHGADIVVHSATKFIGGHGTSLGGVIVDGGTFDWKKNPEKFPGFNKPDASYHGLVFGDIPAPFVTRVRTLLLRDQGAAISPFNAFILLQGLETLSLRVERHVFNTLKVLEYLENQPLVKKINHPAEASHPNHDLYERYFPNGAGSIFTFEIDGDQQKAFDFIDHLKIFSLLANVADVKSLVIHPLSTTHSELSVEEAADQGIYPSTIRLSIGTEHYKDIIADLDQAFEAVK